MRRDIQVARTPTKKAVMHFYGDSDNSDEGDYKASNTGGTDDEEEGDYGEDADDCDAAAESCRLRTMKGDNLFFLPKMQVLAKPFKIFLSSRNEFRKDYERAFQGHSLGNDEYQEDRRAVRVHPAFG